MVDTKTFIRQIEIRKQSTFDCLNIHQKYVGDVGCVVWDAALVLLKYLFTPNGNKYVKGKSVLELGSGTGVVGIGAAVAGSSFVHITDLPEFVSLMNLNIQENFKLFHKNGSKSAVIADVLHWGNEEELHQIFSASTLTNHNTEILANVECVLIADCVYYEEGMKMLYETIVMIMKASSKTCKVLCSYEQRDTGNKLNLLNAFIGLLRSCFHLSYVEKKDMDDEYQCDDIFIFIVSK